jgi:hypothetical protein
MGNYLQSRVVGAYTTVFSMAVDGNNDILVSGQFGNQTDLGGGTIAGPGPNVITDGFLAKYSGALDGNGNTSLAWKWQTLIRGTTGTTSFSAASVAIDNQNNILMTGGCGGDRTFGSITLQNTSNFLAKYSTSGGCLWATQFAGSVYGSIAGPRWIVADSVGNPIITGAFAGTVGFGSHSMTSVGDNDVFLVNYNPNSP